MLSDESKFLVLRVDKHQRVYRRNRERYSDSSLVEFARFRRDGFICQEQNTPLYLSYLSRAINGSTIRRHHSTAIRCSGCAFTRSFFSRMTSNLMAKLRIDYLRKNNFDVMDSGNMGSY